MELLYLKENKYCYHTGYTKKRSVSFREKDGYITMSMLTDMQEMKNKRPKCQGMSCMQRKEHISW